MSEQLNICLAQLNLQVGHLAANTEQICAAIGTARDRHHADLIIFPELALSGYPPEDLLLRQDFMDACEQALLRVADAARGITVIIGYPSRADTPHLMAGNTALLYNTAGIFQDGTCIAEYAKHCLPNYSVFDEKRYFQPGHMPVTVSLKGRRIGLLICEDIWERVPARLTRDEGAELLVVLNASPYHTGKGVERDTCLQQRAQELDLPIVYVNLVGGQDELVFDGGSLAVADTGEIIHRGRRFKESLELIDSDRLFAHTDGPPQPAPVDVAADSTDEEVYQALVLGVRDYVRKNGFKGAVLGLSGGIDSALTLAIAVDALGADAVEAVLMPSPYTREMSNTDAVLQAENLGVAWTSIPIAPAFESFLDLLEEEFAGLPRDVTEENIQARCRGILLMAISNKTGRILLTTGNKSEMAVGYATLYGDMAGGFAPLKDVPKTLVYALANYRNRQTEVIPQRVIDRPPSAELAPDQQDTDSLPDYDTLDAILERYIERDQGVASMIDAGFDQQLVERVIRLVDRNEYKRRQAPPGIKVSSRAFGRERRYPITNGFRP